MRKAEGDWASAQRDAAHPRPIRDSVCFHCQQATEKYLKALLQEAGVAFPRTHDLEELLTIALPAYADLRGLRRGLLFLSDYAVDVRYPGRNATTRQMRAALRWSGRTRQVCRRLLGVRN